MKAIFPERLVLTVITKGAKVGTQELELSHGPKKAHVDGPCVLVVDDDLDILELISFNLIDAGYRVSIAVNGAEAIFKAETAAPSLVILDLNLPDRDGFEICHHLRSQEATREVPILMLTARTKEADRIRGFELGANDYLAKPFSPRELLLRIRNLSQFPQDSTPDQVFRVGELCIHEGAHLVTVAGQPVPLTVTEFRLLTTLAKQNGRVQSRETLLHEVWHGDKALDPRTVDTHMARLREKLGRASHTVDTVYGVGYRFVNV